MKLKELLILKRYNARTLAPLLGVADKTIYSWSYGRCTPNPETIIKLAEILEVSEREILDCFKKEA